MSVGVGCRAAAGLAAAGVSGAGDVVADADEGVGAALRLGAGIVRVGVAERVGDPVEDLVDDGEVLGGQLAVQLAHAVAGGAGGDPPPGPGLGVAGGGVARVRGDHQPAQPLVQPARGQGGRVGEDLRLHLPGGLGGQRAQRVDDQPGPPPVEQPGGQRGVHVGVLLDQLAGRVQPALRRGRRDAQQHRRLQGGRVQGVPLIVQCLRARRQVTVGERGQPGQGGQLLLLAGLQPALPRLGVGELGEQHGPRTTRGRGQRGQLGGQQPSLVEPVVELVAVLVAVLVVVGLLELPGLLGPGVQLLLAELVEPVRVHATQPIEHLFE